MKFHVRTIETIVRWYEVEAGSVSEVHDLMSPTEGLGEPQAEESHGEEISDAHQAPE